MDLNVTIITTNIIIITIVVVVVASILISLDHCARCGSSETNTSTMCALVCLKSVRARLARVSLDEAEHSRPLAAFRRDATIIEFSICGKVLASYADFRHRLGWWSARVHADALTRQTGTGRCARLSGGGGGRAAVNQSTTTDRRACVYR